MKMEGKIFYSDFIRISLPEQSQMNTANSQV